VQLVAEIARNKHHIPLVLVPCCRVAKNFQPLIGHTKQTSHLELINIGLNIWRSQHGEPKVQIIGGLETIEKPILEFMSVAGMCK